MKLYFSVIKLNYKLITLFLCICLISSCIFIYSYVTASENKEGIEVPIIMYHSILNSKSGSYIIHPDTLEKDLIYLKSKNYTSITMTDLIKYVYEDTPLPEKPVIITFDDGHYNNLGYAVPLLKKYDMKGVISIVGKYTDDFSRTDEANLNYGHLRWKDINELINDGTIEFQNHTYNLHTIGARKGAMKKRFESLEDYSNMLSCDILKLQEEFEKNTKYVPNTFTYPYGAISKESLNIVKNLGFKASLSCTAGVNYITKDPNCLYCLKRNNRPNNISSEQFFKKLLK